MKKKIALIIIVIVTVCLFTLPLRRDITQYYACYASHIDDPTYTEQVTVTFNGYYYDYLIKNDRFEGYIDVTPFSLYPNREAFIPTDTYQTVEPTVVEISTDYTSANLISYACLGPYDPSATDNIFNVRGHLYAEEDLKWFIINLYDFTQTGEAVGSYTPTFYLSYPDELTSQEARDTIFPKVNEVTP